MVAVSSHSGVVEGHLQLIHGFQQQTFSLIVEILKGGLLMKKWKKELSLRGSVLTNIWGFCNTKTRLKTLGLQFSPLLPDQSGG